MRRAAKTISPPSLRHLALSISNFRGSAVLLFLEPPSGRCSATLTHSIVDYTSFSVHARKVPEALVPFSRARNIRALTLRSPVRESQCTNADLASLGRH